MMSSRLYSSALSEPLKQQEMPSANPSEPDLEQSVPRISSYVEFPPLNSHVPSPVAACITPATPAAVPRKLNDINPSAASFTPLIRSCEDNYTLSTPKHVSESVILGYEQNSNTTEMMAAPPSMLQAGWHPLITHNQVAPYPTPWPGYGYPPPAPMMAAVPCFGYYDHTVPPWAPWAPWDLPPFANGQPVPCGFGPQTPPMPQMSHMLPYHYPPPSLPIPVAPFQFLGQFTAPSSSQSMRKPKSRSRHSISLSEHRRSSSVDLNPTVEKGFTERGGSSDDGNTSSSSVNTESLYASTISRTSSKFKLRLRRGKQSMTPKRATVPKFTGPRSFTTTIEFNQNPIVSAPIGPKDVSGRSSTRFNGRRFSKEKTSLSNVSWSQSKQWASNEKREIQAFHKMQLNLRYMGADKSPFVPRSAAELAALRATVAESKKERFAREVARRLRMVKKDEDTNEDSVALTLPPRLYTGKKFRDHLSTLFAVVSCFCEGARCRQTDATNWPTIVELKDAKFGLPHPRIPEGDCSKSDNTSLKGNAVDFYSIQPVDDGFGTDIKNMDQAVLEQVPDFVKELVHYIEFQHSA